MAAASPSSSSPHNPPHSQQHSTAAAAAAGSRRQNTLEIATTILAAASSTPRVDSLWCCSDPAGAVVPFFPNPHHHHHQRSAAPSMIGASSPAPAPANYSKFNNALNAGLLNTMSPPPPPHLPIDAKSSCRSSPTLFDMMASEQDHHPGVAAAGGGRAPPPLTPQDRQIQLQERVMEIVGGSSPGSGFNNPDTSDVRLTLTSRDGLAVAMSVHRHILVSHSRFFASKLSDRPWSSTQHRSSNHHHHLVEISDCDDVEIYVETLRLMYCSDPRRRLAREEVRKVLGILKVAAAIAFDAGVVACLEFLEAAPWAEEEEEKVAALLSELRLDGSSGAREVLKRVSLDGGGGAAAGAEGILPRLLQVVLEGKDEKARREMKGLVSKMLRENNGGAGGGEFSKESVYAACGGCLGQLRHHMLMAAASSGGGSAAEQIARQADNLHWILEILIDQQVADDLLRTWAAQEDLAAAHQRIPAVHRHEVSRVTARLFVGIGKGEILVSKEARCLLVRTWLGPFYADFGWMRRSWKGGDRNSVEEGLVNTVLTLPMGAQQEVLLDWFDRFLNSGDDCPNIQRGFEVWWRRAFWQRRGGDGGRDQTPPLPLPTTQQLQISAAMCDDRS